MKIEYHETTLDQVLDYYIKGFAFKKGQVLWRHDSWHDPSGRVILKLYITEEEKDEKV